MKTSPCALSEVTGIPLIRLHGDSKPFDQCEKVIQMSAGYREYAHATLYILNTFGWKNIAVVYDGKSSFPWLNGDVVVVFVCLFVFMFSLKSLSCIPFQNVGGTKLGIFLPYPGVQR